MKIVVTLEFNEIIPKELTTFIETMRGTNLFKDISWDIVKEDLVFTNKPNLPKSPWDKREKIDYQNKIYSPTIHSQEPEREFMDD